MPFLCTGVKFCSFHLVLFLSSPWRAPVSTAGGLTSPPGYEPGCGADQPPPASSGTACRAPRGVPEQVQVPGCGTWSSSWRAQHLSAHFPEGPAAHQRPCKAGLSSMARGPDPQLALCHQQTAQLVVSGCHCLSLSSQTCSSPGPVGAAPLSLPPTLSLTSPF